MIIKQNKWQTILYSVFAFMGGVMLFWFAFFDIRKTTHDYIFWIDNTVAYWMLRSLSFIFGVVILAAIVYLIKEIFSQKPVIEICDEYFYDNSSAIALGKIAWSDMEMAYVKKGLLNIDLKNPEEYFAKKNWLQRLMIRGNSNLGYGHVCISAQRFQKRGEEFFEEFTKRMSVENI